MPPSTTVTRTKEPDTLSNFFTVESYKTKSPQIQKITLTNSEAEYYGCPFFGILENNPVPTALLAKENEINKGLE
ncbi:MAG: hypothetical protein FWG02_04420 [Holophagaceae bacterium]|nr:hypothetical protein [Holophagaceae bacterium]